MVGEVTERIAVARSTALSREIRLRVVSGVALACIGLAANQLGPLWLAGLVLIVAEIMCWEWARVVRGGRLDAQLVLHGLAVAVAASLTILHQPGLALLALLAAGVLLLALRLDNSPGVSALGIAYVGLPVIALIWLRASEPWGAAAILFIFVIVWTTDTFAYVCGTLIGGPKLWPSVSPNKTWAGTLGGVAFATFAAVLFALVLGSGSALGLGLIGLVLSVAAQLGDLAESALKRVFDVRHASELIPGHGGFMDRMDGIVAAAVLAAAGAAIVDAGAPARALLLGL